MPETKIIFLLFIWLSGLFCSDNICSQNQEFYYKKFGTKDGLPSSEVYEIVQDREGYLWFCTDAGVSRYDGYTFQNFTTDDRLTDNVVFHMYEDYKGRIWFLPINSQLCYWYKGKIYPYKYNSELKEACTLGWIRTISIDSTDQLTFVGRRFGRGTISNQGEKFYQTVSDEHINEISIIQKGNDLLVYGLQKEKNLINDTLAWFINKEDKTPIHFTYAEFAKSICQGKVADSTFIIGVGGKTGLYKNGEIVSWVDDSNLQFSYLDDYGQIWMAFHNRGIEIYQSPEAFANGDEPIYHLLADKNISGIYKDNSSGIWIAAPNGGIYYISNPNVFWFDLGNDELTNRVTALYKENDTIYAGTENSKLYEIQPGDKIKLLNEQVKDNKIALNFFVVQTNASGKKEITVANQITARDGTIWTAGYYNLTGVNNDSIVYRSLDQFEKTRFFCLFEDKDGKIWAGSNLGLHQYKKDSLVNMSFLINEKYHVSDIKQLKDGRIVIATFGDGLWTYDEKTGQILHIREGLSSNIIRKINIDNEGDLWLATPKGVNWLRKTANDSFETMIISEIHGLPSNEINSITSIGKNIWVATNKGLVKINKDLFRKNLLPPKIVIDSILVNQQNIGSLYNVGLNYNQNHLEFYFTGLSYRNSEKNLYRHRISGIDQQWVVSNQRIARYPSLQNGNYVFEVQAANEEGNWSESIKIPFIIYPPFWKTWWFLLLLAILFVGLVYLYFKKREIRIKEKNTQLREFEQQKLLAIKSELKALRAQMNPHFTFNTLSAIQTAVNNSEKEKASKYIVDFATLIRKVLENSRHNYITIEEELEMLKLYIKLEQLRFSGRFTYAIEVDDSIESDFTEIPSMVIQPYVENAILHGLSPKKQNGHLQINFSLSKDVITCSIQDNGIGREKAMEIKKMKKLSHHSMALNITEERINLHKQEMGKDFSVEIIDLYDENNLAKGTRVLLQFPV